MGDWLDRIVFCGWQRKAFNIYGTRLSITQRVSNRKKKTKKKKKKKNKKSQVFDEVQSDKSIQDINEHEENSIFYACASCPLNTKIEFK